MNKMKRFIETAGIYLIGNVLSKLIGFFLLPLYTGKLLPEQFGTYDLVVTIISLSAPIAFFQIWDGMFRFTFEKNDLKDKYSVISNSFFVWALGLVLFSTIFLIVFTAFRFKFGWLIFFYGITVSLQYQYLYIARAFLRNKLFTLSGLINSLTVAAVNILFISGFNMGIESLYIASILGHVSQILMIEIVLHPLSNFKIHDVKMQKIMAMLKFSVPLCIGTVFYWLLGGYTKVVISQQLGAYANGLYAVATKFSSMLLLLLTVFQYAWNEMAYFISEDGDRTEKYRKSIEYIFKLVLSGSGVFMLFSKLIFPYFIDHIYRDALMIVPLSLIAAAINGFAGFIDTIFMAEKQTRWIFKTTIVGAGINIAALWIFTPVWGIYGAIGALCFALTALALFRLSVLGRRFAIKFQQANLLYFLILAVAICIFYTVHDSIWLMLGIALLSGISIYCLRGVLLPLWERILNKI